MSKPAIILAIHQRGIDSLEAKGSPRKKEFYFLDYRLVMENMEINAAQMTKHLSFIQGRKNSLCNNLKKLKDPSSPLFAAL